VAKTSAPQETLLISHGRDPNKLAALRERSPSGCPSGLRTQAAAVIMEASMQSRKNQKADFLVIGSGIAGLRAAIELGRAGNVLILSKGDLFESNTEYAQGGIAAAMSEDDEVCLHLHDTLQAGDGLCREEAVRVLVEDGPETWARAVDEPPIRGLSVQWFAIVQPARSALGPTLHDLFRS